MGFNDIVDEEGDALHGVRSLGWILRPVSVERRVSV